MGKRSSGKNDRIRLIEEKSSNKSYRTAQNSGSEKSRSNVGVSVVWKDLRVTARITKQRVFGTSEHSYKEIIHEVNGCVKPSSLVAIMGASGSGKSTLMSVLANRHPGELRIDGDIRINGKRVLIEHLRRISGYVYQDDLFIPTLTVLEHLNFAAQLKLDCRISSAKREQIIHDLLMDVGLTKCGNSYIGSSGFGKGKVNLSGGEQKRLSVATELLTDPPLLFCDEPTTGLDSFSALKLMSVMRDLCLQKDKTIICSIHQPNEQIFNLFHQVILLYSGNIAFSGTPAEAVQFFQRMEFSHNDTQNSAEYLVRSLAIIPGHESESGNRSTDICHEFQKSEYAEEMFQFIEENTQDYGDRYPAPPEVEKHSGYYVFKLMIYRNFLSVIRDPSLQFMSIIYKTILALIIGLCLMGSCTWTQEGVQSLKGALFTMVAENCFGPAYAAMERIPKLLPIFMREYTNNMTTPVIFYLALLITITPGLLIDSLVFTTLLYNLIGLQANLNIFIWTAIINIITLNISNGFGTLLSVVTNSYESAQLVVLPMDVIYMVLAGIFISLRTVPIILYWIRYISWMTLSCEALCILHLANVTDIACSDDPEQPCYRTGEEVLEQLDFSSNDFSRNLITLITLYVFIHGAALITFSMKMKNRTKAKSMNN